MRTQDILGVARTTLHSCGCCGCTSYAKSSIHSAIWGAAITVLTACSEVIGPGSTKSLPPLPTLRTTVIIPDSFKVWLKATPGGQVTMHTFDDPVYADVWVTGSIMFTSNPAAPGYFGPINTYNGPLGAAGTMDAGGTCGLYVNIYYPTTYGTNITFGPCVGSSPSKITSLFKGTGTAKRGPAIIESGRTCLPMPCHSQSDSQQVWISPLPTKLVLTPSSVQVTKGTQVTFNVSADPNLMASGGGRPRRVTAWRWRRYDDSYHGSDTTMLSAYCTQTTQSCRPVIQESGTISVDAIVNGTAQTESAYVVVIPANSTQEVLVSCTQGPTRGGTVGCVTRLKYPMPFTVVHRQAIAADFTVNDATRASVDAGMTDVWQGTAVVSADVTVTVETANNGVVTRLTNPNPGQFSVQPRAWPQWGISNITEAISTRRPMAPYPNKGAWGVFEEKWPWPDSVSILRATTGPNQGAAIIRDPYVLDAAKIWIHPALVPPGTPGRIGNTESDQWYSDQNGVGGGGCVAADVATLLGNVRRHEGITLAPNSHVGTANQQFAQSRPDTAFEALHTIKPDADLRNMVHATLDFLFGPTSGYVMAHKQFDNGDLLITNHAGIPCNFDFTRENP